MTIEKIEEVFKSQPDDSQIIAALKDWLKKEHLAESLESQSADLTDSYRHWSAGRASAVFNLLEKVENMTSNK